MGTKLNLRSWASDPGAETFVALTEGKLSLQPLKAPAKSVVLNPGESSSVQGDSTTPASPSVSPVGQTLLWMEGRLSFQNRPIGQIIRELERRYNLSIKVETTEILSDSLTIYYSNRIEAEQAIKDICLSKGVTYRQTNNGFVIEH
ncbi:MAG: DUF4974 domain-containing protein [Balneolaceae bacterium]|nr:DUF4974 domain-containing protein [Balneolaceae bacterium]